MTTLPTEEALREMRGIPSGDQICEEIKDDELFALLDCALTMRRLERWLLDFTPLERSATISMNSDDDGKLGGWQVDLEDDVNVHSCVAFASDIQSALAAALDKAEHPERTSRAGSNEESK